MFVNAKAAETLAAALFGVALSSGVVKIDAGIGVERQTVPSQVQIEAPAQIVGPRFQDRRPGR